MKTDAEIEEELSIDATVLMDAITLNNLDIFEASHGFDASLSSLSKTYRREDAEKG